MCVCEFLKRRVCWCAFVLQGFHLCDSQGGLWSVFSKGESEECVCVRVRVAKFVTNHPGIQRNFETARGCVRVWQHKWL